MSGSRDYDDRHSSSYFRRSSTPEEHASTIPRMPAPGGKTKSCRNDWYEELSGVAKPTNSPSSYKHKSSTRLPTKCSYECLEAVSSEPSRRALRAEHGNVRRATDYITKLRPKQRYWSISSADVEAERLSSRKVSLAEKESGSESDSSSHSFERLRPSNSRSFTESKSRSKEGISDLSLSDSAPITQRSLAALLRLEIQYQEVEEMIGLLMDFRRHCSDADPAFRIETLTRFADQVGMSLAALNNRLHKMRDYWPGKEEPTLVEWAARSLLALFGGPWNDRVTEVKAVDLINKGHWQPDEGYTKVEAIERFLRQVKKAEAMFLGTGSENGDDEGIKEEDRKREIGELKVRLFRQILEAKGRHPWSKKIGPEVTRRKELGGESRFEERGRNASRSVPPEDDWTY